MIVKSMRQITTERDAGVGRVASREEGGMYEATWLYEEGKKTLHIEGLEEP